MKKALLGWVILMSLAYIASAQCIVGSYTTVDFPITTGTGAGYSWTANLILKSEAGSARTITSITIFLNNPATGTWTFNNQRIYIRQTTATNYPDASHPGLAGFTKVFDGNVVFTNSGAKTINFNTNNGAAGAFSYNGTDNLEILWENRSGASYAPPSDVWWNRGALNSATNRTKRQYDSDPSFVFNRSGARFHYLYKSSLLTECVLPVELLQFTAKPTPQGTLLAWDVAWEVNNDYYSIQHSADGEHFNTIGKVKGFGTTDEKKHYSYLHPEPAHGKNYYRLGQTDINGTTRFYDVVELSATRDILPIIIWKESGITITGLAAGGERGNIQITDLSGKSLGEYSFVSENGDTQVFPLVAPYGGVILITIIWDNGQRASVRAIKQ